jgi:membrane dipeptidase
MKRISLLFLLFLAAAWICAAPPADDVRARAERILRSAIVVDTHEDVPEQLEKEWVDIGFRQETGHVDIPRWREGSVTAPFLAAYVSSAYAASGKSAKKALEFMDLIHRLVEMHPGDLVFADSVAGIQAARRENKIAILIGIEGGHAIGFRGNPLRVLSAGGSLHDADAHEYEQLGGFFRLFLLLLL